MPADSGEAEVTRTIQQTVAHLAKSAAEAVHKRFRDHIELDDLVQECWVWYVSHQDQADAWITGGTPGRLRSRMFRAAQKAARRQKAAAGYSTEDEVFYSTRGLLELLPEALDPEAVPSQTMSEAGRVSGASKVGYDEWHATIADVRAAFGKLSTVDQEILTLHCRWGYSPDALGVHYGIPTDVAYKRIGRAVRRMRGRLGGPNPW